MANLSTWEEDKAMCKHCQQIMSCDFEADVYEGHHCYIVSSHEGEWVSPNLMWQSRDRKTCPMMNVKSMLTDVAIDIPADLISAGWISAGTNHPRGPLHTSMHQHWPFSTSSYPQALGDCTCTSKHWCQSYQKKNNLDAIIGSVKKGNKDWTPKWDGCVNFQAVVTGTSRTFTGSVGPDGRAQWLVSSDTRRTQKERLTMTRQSLRRRRRWLPGHHLKHCLAAC